MNYTSRSVTFIYLMLTLLTTLAASFIWGINTLFLLDAGLNNTEAFAANAAFTAGEVLFEVPTGVLADFKGRRLSFLLGCLTLSIVTLSYLYMWQISAPFWGWAITSLLLGLGFTFFSGATEAWLVDALSATGYQDSLEKVLAKGQIVIGIGMLTGSIAGGLLAQYTNLAIPYLCRTFLLLISFIVAFWLMQDLGFKPKHGFFLKEMKKIFSISIKYGLKNPPVRWQMFAVFFVSGVSIFAFYALQPYLLQLYGNPNAYAIAGIAAASIAFAQIVGGILVPYVRKLFKKRTTALIIGTLINTIILIAMGLVTQFWLIIIFIIIWSLIFAAVSPIRQAYINALIPSEQRATVLSFDSLMGSLGGVAFQPVLGKVSDMWNYAVAYILSGILYALALPFLWLARRENVSADKIN